MLSTVDGFLVPNEFLMVQGAQGEGGFEETGVWPPTGSSGGFGDFARLRWQIQVGAWRLVFSKCFQTQMSRNEKNVKFVLRNYKL